MDAQTDRDAPAGGDEQAEAWGAGFPEDDPRAEMPSPEQRAKAVKMMQAKGRWHYRNKSVDMLAARLQFGRGMPILRVARMFGISPTCIRDRIDDDKWLATMSEYDRRDLSRLVWLAGTLKGAREDEQRLAALRAASEWRVWQPEQPTRWRPRDRHGEQRSMTPNTEISDDAYTADSGDEERDEMLSRLDAIIASYEAGPCAEEEGEAEADGEGGATAEDCDVYGGGAEAG